MYARVRRRFCSARRTRRRSAALVMIRFTCVISLLVGTYVLDLPSLVKSHVVTYVKMLLFPGDKPGGGSTDEPGSQRSLGEANREPLMSTLGGNENPLNHRVSADLTPNNNIENDGKLENMFIDLNSRPQRMHGQAPMNQERGDALVNNNHESESVVPVGFFKREPEK